MAGIRSRSGKHQVVWRNLAGKECWRTCPTKATARNLKLDVEAALAEGRDWEPEITGREPLIQKVAEAYIDHRSLTKRADTLRMDGTYLDVFVRFAGTKAKDPTVSLLSRPLLDEYMAWLAKPETSVHDKRRAGVTIAKFVRAAQQMWAWAEESERWPGMIPRPRMLRKDELPDSDPGPVNAPTWADMDACVRACKTPTLRKLAVWLRYTGLRVSESMHIKWEDIDLERKELTIRPEVDKRKRGRIVPLSKLILDEIKTWTKCEVGEEKREGYLIPSGRQEGPREREARSRDMGRAWQRAGVKESIYRRRPDHAFRKGFKSELLAAGAHRDAIDYLQGHGEGSRWRYIDPRRLPLREALALVPAVADAPQNVTKIPSKKAAP